MKAELRSLGLERVLVVMLRCSPASVTAVELKVEQHTTAVLVVERWVLMLEAGVRLVLVLVKQLVRFVALAAVVRED